MVISKMKEKKKLTKDGKDEEHLTNADAFTLGASTKAPSTVIAFHLMAKQSWISASIWSNP